MWYIRAKFMKNNKKMVKNGQKTSRWYANDLSNVVKSRVVKNFYFVTH